MGFEGFLMPNGSMPPGITNNGKRSRNAENVRLNQQSYMAYLYRLEELAMSVFEWSGLPRGVDQRMLEYWLLHDGFCVFFHDDDLKTGQEHENAPDGYAVLQAAMGGNLDMYQYPTDRRAYSVSGLNIPLDESNSVIMFNNFGRVPMYPTLSLYAQRLAEIDRTIDVNVQGQKTPKVISTKDAQRLSFENLVMDVQGNSYWVLADKSLDLKDINVLDLSTPYVSNDLQVLKHQYWNEALTYLGVENVTTEKKERLVSDEVLSNMGDVEAQRFVRLNARKQACEEINELFGLEVDCNFRSGMYIKADGYGARQLSTTGMKDGAIPSEPGAGYGIQQSVDQGGIIAQLKRILGM